MKQVLVLLTLGLAAGSTAVENPISYVVDIFRNEPTPSQETVDIGTDNALNKAKVKIDNNEFSINFNPLLLPDISDKAKGGLIPLLFKLTNGKLYGFNTIYRHNKVKLIYTEDLVDLQVDIGYKKLKAIYDFSTILVKGKLTADIKDFVFSLHIFMNRKTFKVAIKENKAVSIGAVDIKLEGNGLLDSLVSTLLTLLSNILKNVVMSFVTPQIIQVITDLVKEANDAV